MPKYKPGAEPFERATFADALPHMTGGRKAKRRHWSGFYHFRNGRLVNSHDGMPPTLWRTVVDAPDWVVWVDGEWVSAALPVGE